MVEADPGGPVGVSGTAENEFSEENLMELQGLVASLFRVENSDVEHLADVVSSIARIYEKEASDELKRDFLLWLRHMLAKKKIAPVNTLDQAEVRHMLLANLDKLEAKILHKGRKEGLEKGRKEGLRKGLEQGQTEGCRTSVRLLLESTFGLEGLALQAQVDAETSLEKLQQLIRLVAQGTDLPSIRRELWPE